MSGRDQLPDQHVPDKVLEELLAAFGPGPHDLTAPDAPAGDVAYDFDDPSIDRLLGIDTVNLTAPAPPAAERRGIGPVVVEPEPDETTIAAPTPAPPAPTSRRAARSARKAATAAPPTATPVAPAPPADGASGDGRTPSRKERKAQRRAAAAAAATAASAAPPDVAPAAAADAATTSPSTTPATAPNDAAAPAKSATGATTSADNGRRTIVIADDDQHVDPIYLDEDAENRLRELHSPSDATRARSTIVIDEFDLHTDAVPALASSSATIDPRLRARRIAVRRAVGRRRLVWAGVIAAVVLVVVAVVAVFASSLFDVRQIDTQGNVYASPALIESVRKELRGEPVLLVDTRKLERQLETDPWIESARVSTDFPHRVLIDIRERVPQATFAGSDGRFRVIDRDGRVLAVLDGQPIAYMLLTGTAPDSEPGQFAGTAYAAAAQLVIALPPEIRSITTSIAVDTTTNELTLAMDAPGARGVQARLGTVSGIEDKLARLLRFVHDGLQPDQRLDVSTAQVGT